MQAILFSSFLLPLSGAALHWFTFTRKQRHEKTRDEALLKLGEARGRQAILDDVRMLEHGQLKAHVLAVQHCIEQARAAGGADSYAWIDEASSQIQRLLDVVVSLHRSTSDSALPDDFEQTLVDVTRSLATAYPRCTCRVEVNGRRQVETPEPVRRALTLTLYNALANAFTHANPAHVTVQLQYAPDVIILVVTDDGCGLPSEAPVTNGRGLRDIRQLVESLDGAVTLTSSIRTGTVLRATLPLTTVTARTEQRESHAPHNLSRSASC
jgi:two-component sensor histidine kinase